MPEHIALIISNPNYQDNTLARLKTPEGDVHTLASVLSDPTVGHFTSLETLTDQPSHKLRRQIRDLFHWRKRHDVLLLYVSGHAVLDESGQLYLAATDTKLDALQETAISASYISECMDRSFSRQQILILDCYHSRILAPGARGAPGSSTDTGAAFEGKGYWRVVLTANDITQYVIKGDEVLGEPEDSIFTPYLIQGLRTGALDLDGDGRIGIGELTTHIQDQVARHNPNQQPRIWRYDERDEFIIAYSPKRVEPKRPIKWDILIGALTVPAVTILLGAWADLNQSIGFAGLFLLFYAFLYWAPD